MGFKEIVSGFNPAEWVRSRRGSTEKLDSQPPELDLSNISDAERRFAFALRDRTWIKYNGRWRLRVDSKIEKAYSEMRLTVNDPQIFTYVSNPEGNWIQRDYEL